MPSDLDVVVIGNVGIDTNVYLTGPPDLGVESSFVEVLDCVGQAGGYTARGFARLGLRTAFLGFVGDDTLGHKIRRELGADGIDLSGLFVDPAGTSRSINLMRPDGRRNNFYDGKSHMDLRIDLDRCRTLLARARHAHFHIPNWARHLLAVARDLGVTVSCDLQDVTEPDDPYRRDFIEAAQILFFSAVNTSPEPLLRRLEADERTVVAGLGERGCLVLHRGQVQRYAAHREGGPVVDTNGAGDSLAVGFLSSFLFGGYSVSDSVFRGQVAARHACTLRGQSSRLIDAATLEERFRRQLD